MVKIKLLNNLTDDLTLQGLAKIFILIKVLFHFLILFV